MPTSTNVTNLKINELTEAQYDTAVQQGIIGENELSVLTDAEAGQVIQVATMPTAAVGEEGKIYQFIGTTDANYTNGYFYKCTGTTTPSSATATQTTGSSLSNVAVVVATFETQITTSGSYSFTSDGANWSYDGNTVDLTNYGITYTGTPVADDVITVVYAEESTTYGWAQTDVQPAGQTIQYATIPTANAETVGKIIQYIGATDSTYKQGCFYIGMIYSYASITSYYWNLLEPLKDYYSTSNQLALGVGSGVKTTGSGNQGVAIGPSSYATHGGTAVGQGAKANGKNSVSIGYGNASGENSIAVGSMSQTSARLGIAIGTLVNATAIGAIQLGGYSKTNSDANTFKVANDNGNYEMMDADGTIPTDRFTTTPSADGTYVPTLTISSGVATRSWAAPSGGGSTALSLTLAAANWSNNTITVTATGVTASNNVIVSPAPASQSAYTTAGVMCTGQSTNSLTFTTTTTPSSDLTVNVLII